MKVIRPIEVYSTTAKNVSGANLPSTDINSSDTAPVWSSTTTYTESSKFDKVFVQYNGKVYESIKPNNLNNIPSTTNSIYWKYITDLSIDEFAIGYWSGSTTYNIGDIVVSWPAAPTGLFTAALINWPTYYQSLRSSNLGNTPRDNISGDNPYWLELGPSNSSKLYDIESITQTVTTDELITNFTAKKTTAVGLFNLSATKVLVTAKSERNIYNTTSWVEGTAISSNTPVLNGMCFAAEKNMLLICGNSGVLKYSKDNGSTWIDCVVPNTSSNLKSIAYSEDSGIFIAVGTTTSLTTSVIWRSEDGITWINLTGLPDGSSYINKIIYIKSLGVFVAAAHNGNIYKSSDSAGSSWTAQSVGAGSPDLVDIVYNPANGLVHVCGSQVLARSSNLSTWSLITGSGVTGFNIRAISVFNYKDLSSSATTTQYLYVGTNIGTGVNFAYYSPTGTSTFSQLTLPISNSNIPTSLTYCYSERKWVINCTGVVLSLVQDFSTTYETVTPVGFDTSRGQLYYNSSTDTLFLFGNNSTLITSALTYFKEYSLNTTLIDNWYSYFYEDYSLLPEAIFQNIPSYNSTRITVSIVGDIIRCGIILPGISASIGTTQYGASAGIIDYSKKETDEFGNTTFVKRSFSKRMNTNIILPSSDLYRVQKVLSDIRATPCIWIGSEAEIYKPLVMYGYYRDFNLEIPYPEYSYCSLQIEGLTE